MTDSEKAPDSIPNFGTLPISSRIKSSCMLFDDMHSRLLKLMGDKAVYRPGSINEAKLLLKLTKEFSDSLRSMVFELNKCGGTDEKSSIS